MAENSRIEWTDHTFKPWWGCTKVSAACHHCYAEGFAKRVGKPVWGPKAGRRTLSDKNWAEPVRWNAAAKAIGRRARVFCASMADVFEDRRDLDEHRERLWRLIDATPHLDWLLLTKRHDAVLRLSPWGDRWPANVWMGMTIEDQEAADTRLPVLTQIPAAVCFISAEPLFGPLDLSQWIDRLDWVIAGGESGVHARISSPSWFRDPRDQCVDADIAFLFKQWGEWAPYRPNKGSGRIAEAEDGATMQRLGKRLLADAWTSVSGINYRRRERLLERQPVGRFCRPTGTQQTANL